MKKLKEYDRPAVAALVHIGVWAAVTYGLFLYSTELTRSLIPFILGFLIVYPLGTLYMTFRYSKRYGLKWYFVAAIAIIMAAAYYLLGFNNVEPNFIVMTLLALFFGCGFGNLNHSAAEPKKKKRENDDYKSILDS